MLVPHKFLAIPVQMLVENFSSFLQVKSVLLILTVNAIKTIKNCHSTSEKILAQRMAEGRARIYSETEPISPSILVAACLPDFFRL